MSNDADKRVAVRLQQLRKLKGFASMTPAEADAAFEAAPADDISEEEIQSLVEFVSSGGKASWEPKSDTSRDSEIDLGEVENEALQLYRNRGEDDEVASEEDSLREELLSDEEIEDEAGMDHGQEPPVDGR